MKSNFLVRFQYFIIVCFFSETQVMEDSCFLVTRGLPRHLAHLEHSRTGWFWQRTWRWHPVLTVSVHPSFTNHFLFRRFPKSYLKTVKLKESPSLIELVRQMELITRQFDHIVSLQNNVIIRLQRIQPTSPPLQWAAMGRTGVVVWVFFLYSHNNDLLWHL